MQHAWKIIEGLHAEEQEAAKSGECVAQLCYAPRKTQNLCKIVITMFRSNRVMFQESLVAHESLLLDFPSPKAKCNLSHMNYMYDEVLESSYE